MSSTNNKPYRWLPHLETSIPKDMQGYKVSSYAVALEGWRRGLTLKYIDRQRNPLKVRYSLSDGHNEYIFAGSRGNLVTDEAIRICIDKHLTKKYLQEANVPTPEGEKFDKDTSDEEIIAYALELGFPLVIKPVSGSGGSGVIANIKDETEFIKSLKYVREDLNYPNVIVEKFFEGIDYRVYVIGDKAVAAFDRIPANVIGDGIHTIERLLKNKIAERQKNPALYNRPIIVDDEVHTLLAQKNYTLETIPKKGERVFLKTKNNVSSGGDSRDVTDEMTDEIKEIAVAATKAIPGLVQAGIDIIVDKKNNTGVVLEINSRPSIRNHLFPMEGIARDIPKEIIDYYFPETQDEKLPDKNKMFYFELNDVFKLLQKGYAKELTIPKIPTGEIKLISYDLIYKSQGTQFANWVSKKARLYNLHGFIELRNNGAKVVVAGKKKVISKFDSLLRNKLQEMSSQNNLELKEWNHPIKTGFEIIKPRKKQAVKKNQKELKPSIFKRLIAKVLRKK